MKEKNKQSRCSLFNAVKVKYTPQFSQFTAIHSNNFRVVDMSESQEFRLWLELHNRLVSINNI